MATLSSSALVGYRPDAVVVEGVLRPGETLWVNQAGRVTAPPPSNQPSRIVELPGRVLMPGLVNAHSHAFQRLLRGRTEFLSPGAQHDDFWTWREAMYRAANALEVEELKIVSRFAFLEMARAGITTVGEFHYLHHQPDGTPYATRTALASAVIDAALEVGVRIVLLRVAYARSGYQLPPNPLQRRFIDSTIDLALDDAHTLGRQWRHDDRVRVGFAPHSVRAVPASWLEASRAWNGPLHMHVAEQRAEVERCQAEHGRRPVELLAELGLLHSRFTAVHGVFVERHEAKLLGDAGASVCVCPTTERNLGDGIVPADELERAGVAVCLGSDSQAQVDLFEEARLVEGHLRLRHGRRNVLAASSGPEALAGSLLRWSTSNGDLSLGLEPNRLGVGQRADFITLDVNHPSLAGVDSLQSALFAATPAAVSEVYVGGSPIVEAGRHRLEHAAVETYRQVQRALRP